MKYDDASWHYTGDFPADQPKEQGGTHIFDKFSSISEARFSSGVLVKATS
ncbi:hypothetical protein [Pseudomonas viridiflava]|nr:hypothetical protein [Pseudomonas viridiflava]MDY0918936.1 hypothetical protein [Pseudomonas viridiflava]